MAAPIPMAHATLSIGHTAGLAAGSAVASGMPLGLEIPSLQIVEYSEGAREEKNRVRCSLSAWLTRCVFSSETERTLTLDKLCKGWYVPGERRLRGKLLKSLFANQTAEAAVAMLAPIGIEEAPALSIFRGATSSTGAATPAVASVADGKLDPSSGVSASAVAAAASTSSSAAGPPRDGGEQSDTHRPAQAQPQAQPKRSEAWDASSCSRCGAAVGALSALVVDDKVCCDACYGTLEGDVQRVDLRIGTGRDARTVGISRAAQGVGSTENEVLRLTRQWERRRRQKCPDDGMVMGEGRACFEEPAGEAGVWTCVA